MQTLTHPDWRRRSGRFDTSIRSAFLTAGSLLLTVLTVLILFFGVFLSHSR